MLNDLELQTFLEATKFYLNKNGRGHEVSVLERAELEFEYIDEDWGVSRFCMNLRLTPMEYLEFQEHEDNLEHNILAASNIFLKDQQGAALVTVRISLYHTLSFILPGGKGYLRAVRSYVAAFIAGPPEQYLGHNPVGRLGIAVLFLLLAIQVITGLVLAGTDLFYPPLGHWIAQWVAAPDVAPGSLVPYAPKMYDAAAYESMRAFRKPFPLVHLYSFYVLVVVVVMHVAAVIVTELREGGSIISAMITGRKIIGGRPVDQDRGSHD
jgi:cytochrome b